MAPSHELVLRGTITAIDVARLGHAGRFVVRLAVEAVEQGAFAGDHFDFPVHSPEKSGLSLGQSLTVRAIPAPGGWTVDPLQWLPRKPR